MFIHKFSYLKRFVQLILVVALLNSNLTMASAGTDWDSALDDINGLHGNYTSLQTGLKSDSSKIQILRKQNNDTLKSIHSVIESTDKALLSRLSSEATSAQKKHAPLLEQYSTLSKQSTAAKKARDFKTVTLLDLRRNKLKAAVTLARTEIKAKTDALATARKQTAAKIKPIKDALAPITALKKQITAENKNISVAQKARSEADKLYKSAVKQGDAITAATKMRASYEQMLRIHSMQQNIYTWEQKISLALRAAESKLP
jgi:predicted  nucleic acid-binding Zn-ribbon protein